MNPRRYAEAIASLESERELCYLRCDLERAKILSAAINRVRAEAACEVARPCSSA